MPRWQRCLAYWGFWTILGIVNAASAVIDAARYQPRIAAWEPVVWEMSSLYTIGMLYPAVAYAAALFPFSRRNWFRMALIHCALIIPFSALHTSGMAGIRTSVYWFLDVPYTFGGGRLFQQVIYEFYKDITLYWTLLAVAFAFDYYRKFRDRELQAAQLQGKLAEAQLQNLRVQLNPHFLFNTLNMISSRMYDDPAEADRMISRLSDLLRFSLKSSDEAEVPLRTEVEMLDLYLEIMKARFGDAIAVDVRIDRAAQNLLVPTLILQPLVENAFRHAFAGKAKDGRLEVQAVSKNGTLTLAVRDNGPGMHGSNGAGLTNTKERLQRLYGDRGRTSLRNREAAEGGGLEVVIEIPSRPGR